MKLLLFKLLKLRENEGKKVFLFFIFALFLQSGVSIGESVSSSLFLINVGFEQLPIIYILIPAIIIMIYFPIYSFYLKRYTEEKFFKISLIFLTIVNILIVLSIKYLKVYIPPQFFNLLFYFIILYTIVWATALYTLFWNFIDGFFNILDSKRIFSIFSAGTALGAIFGGSLVTILTSYISAVDLFFLWSLFSILTLVMLNLIGKTYKTIPMIEEEEEIEGIVKQLSFMVTAIFKSPYVLYLTAAFFVTIILATTLEFEYMGIISKNQTEESLAALFGKLFVVVNIFNLVVNFFLFNRLVLNYGVRNLTLIQPMAYIVAFAYLSVTREFEAALFGFFVVQGIAVAIDYNNQNLLYNGIKSSIKYKVRTFIENLGEPLAVAVAGVLLIFLSDNKVPFFIAYFGGAIAFFYLIIILFLRAEYPKTMVENFKSDWLDFSYDSDVLLSNIDVYEVEKLNEYAENEQSKELALHILAQFKPLDALLNLLAYLNNTSRRNVDNNRMLLKKLLNYSDANIPLIVIRWVENNMHSLNLNLIRELGVHGFISIKKISPMFASTDPKRQATSAVVLLNSPFPDDISKANDIIYTLMQNDDVEYLREGIYALGESKHSEYAFFVSKFLEHENKDIRYQALEAILTLSNKNMNRLVPNILKNFKNSSVKEKEISINILKKIHDSQCIIPLLEESDILTPFERRSIISLIEDLGLQTIPSIVTILAEDRFSYAARSIAARTLSKLAFAQFKSLEEELIAHEIELAYRHLFTHYHIELSLNEESNSRLRLLSTFYKDIHKNTVEFILELLTIGGRLADFEMIKTSLNSDNAKSRGNAIETIEQSTDKKIFSMLLPLIDQRSINDSMEFYESSFNADKLTIDDIIKNALLSNNALEQSIALEVVYYTSSKYKELFRKLLLESKSEDVKSALILLLKNEELKTKIYKLILLSQNYFFSSFNIFELSMLIEDSSIVDMKKEEEFFKNELSSIYISIDNETESIIGLEYIFKEQHPPTTLCKEDGKYLQLKNRSIIQSIHSYPTMGIIFSKKMSAYEII